MAVSVQVAHDRRTTDSRCLGSTVGVCGWKVTSTVAEEHGDGGRVIALHGHQIQIAVGVQLRGYDRAASTLASDEWRRKTSVAVAQHHDNRAAAGRPCYIGLLVVV